jgi:hypothetical protein
MSEWSPEERLALEAVAERFSATRENGENPPDACLSVGGRRIAVAIASIAGRRGIAKPRLRYDRVAIRFIQSLRGALREALPGSTAAIFTASAPIKLPKKAVPAIVEKIRSHLAGKSKATEIKAAILGNRIRIRILSKESAPAPEAVGFVLTAGSNSDIVLDTAQSLLERLRAEGKTPAPRLERWFVIVGESSLSETCRDVCAQLSAAADFKKILMVSDGGRIEVLAG